MAFEELSSELTLDAGDYVSSADEAADATGELGDRADETSDSLFDLDAGGVAAGGALAGVGTAAQGALDSTQKLRETLNRTAASTELTGDEASSLAREMSNATFPIEDAAGTMDELAQAGIENEGALRETATAADLVADATGNSAESISSNAVPAIKAMGGDAEDLTEHMDTFTFVARETQMSVDDFSRIVTKTGPELQEMGLSVDETAAIMTTLEERGLDSRTAMREFRQAARDAEGDQGKLMETLGITNEELEGQQEALEDAAGMTEEHADAANESFTAMDELKAGFEDVKLQTANLLGPMDAAIPAIQGVGIAAIGLSTIGFSSVVPSLTAVMASLTPLLPIILGVAAAAAGLYAAWETNFLGIRDIVINFADTAIDVFETIKRVISDVLSAVWDSVIKPLLQTIRDAWDEHGQDLINSAKAAFENIRSKIDTVLSAIWTGVIKPLLQTIRDAWDAHGKDLINSAKAAFENIRSKIDTVLSAIWTGVIKPIISTIQSAWDVFGEDILSIARTVFDSIHTVIETVMNNILEVVDLILDLLAGDWEDAWQSVKNIVDNTLSAIITLIENAVSIFSDAIGMVIDAIKAPFEALYTWLIGGSIIPDMFDDVVSWLTETATSKVGGAIDAVVGSIKDGFAYVFGTGDDTLLGDIQNAFSEIVEWVESAFSDSFGDAFGSAIDAVETAWNGAIPDRLAVPRVSVGGQSINIPKVDVPKGPTVGGGSVAIPEISVGGQSFDIPQLQSGGLLTNPGLFVGGEAGEELVLNAEQTAQAEQGGVAVGDVEQDVERALERTDRTDEILQELERLNDAIRDDGGRVREQDVVRGLQRIFDRQGVSL